MTENERLVLINQFDILSLLKPDESYYSSCREILENGYEVLYSEITIRLSEPMVADEGQFVIEVLQMHRNLLFSYMSLEDKEDLTEEDVAFNGFDGNEEGKYYTFAEFYIEDFNRFPELKENEFNAYNSHSNKVAKYSRMLELWSNTHERHANNLTADEIRAILEA